MYFIFFGRNKLRLKKIMCLPKRLNTIQLRSCSLLLSFILIFVGGIDYLRENHN